MGGMHAGHSSPFPGWKTALALAGAFLAIALAVYSPAINGEFLTWDDALLVTQNENVQTLSPQTIKNAFTGYDPELYIPLTFMSYHADMIVGGGSPTMFHLQNIALHVINALLVAWLLWLLLGRGWLAAALGLLFLLHPLNVEAGAWISARKDVLSTAFFLGSLVGYVCHRRNDSRALYWLSLGLFLLGLLSKVMVITLPVVLLLIDLHEHKRIGVRNLLSTLPFFALSGIFGVVALFGKSDLLVQTTLVQKILMAFKSTWFYLTAFVWPHPLSVMYPYTQPITLSSPDFAVPLIVIALLIATAVWTLRKTTAVAFGAAFFLVTLAPTFVNFAKGGDVYYASDRYAYIPMIGLLFLAGAALSHWLDTAAYREQARRQNLAAGGLALAALIFLPLSFAQAGTWRSSQALYEQVVAHYPDAHAARTNLGMEYMQSGRLDDAQREFEAAIRIRDDAFTRINLASNYLRNNLADQAIAQYRRAIEITPDEASAHYGLGSALQSQKKTDEAEREYLEAVRLDPSHAMAWNNLGGLRLTQQRWTEAAQALDKAVELHPRFPEAWLNLALARREAGDKPAAIAAYESAFALITPDPLDMAELAWLYYETGKIPAAADRLKTSLQADGGNERSMALIDRMKQDGVAE